MPDMLDKTAISNALLYYFQFDRKLFQYIFWFMDLLEIPFCPTKHQTCFFSDHGPTPLRERLGISIDANKTINWLIQTDKYIYIYIYNTQLEWNKIALLQIAHQKWLTVLNCRRPIRNDELCFTAKGYYFCYFLKYYFIFE